VIARIRKAMANKDDGFTLVELLVVMIIIGILAAIAIPVFMNQQVKARETSAKTDASTIGKAIIAYYIDGTAALTASGSGGTWTLTAGGATVDTGKLSNGNTVVAGTVSSVTSFCVAVQPSDGATHAWKYSQDGLASGTC
jgi:type IV pilus assembly protein PilA